MSDYDVLFGVVLRLPDKNGAGIYKNIDAISEKLAELIKPEYENYLIMPFGLELVESDGVVRILDKMEYPVEYEDEVEE